MIFRKSKKKTTRTLTVERRRGQYFQYYVFDQQRMALGLGHTRRAAIRDWKREYQKNAAIRERYTVVVTV